MGNYESKPQHVGTKCLPDTDCQNAKELEYHEKVPTLSMSMTLNDLWESSNKLGELVTVLETKVCQMVGFEDKDLSPSECSPARDEMPMRDKLLLALVGIDASIRKLDRLIGRMNVEIGL